VLALILGLVVGGFYLPLGSASGQLTSIATGESIQNLKGSGNVLPWVVLVSGLFRLFYRLMQRTWELENLQAAIQIAKRELDGKDRQEMIARILETWIKLPRPGSADLVQKKPRPTIKRTPATPKALARNNGGSRVAEVEAPPEL
jgi:hypothetical protein